MDKTLQKVIKQLEILSKTYVKAGILPGATYVDTGELIAPIARMQEYGSPEQGIPARPFMRITESQNSRKWAVVFKEQVAKGIRSGNLNAVQIYSQIGRKMKDDIKATIDSGVPPPNAPETILRKQRKDGTAPGTLRDTYTMYKAIDFEVGE